MNLDTKLNIKLSPSVLPDTINIGEIAVIPDSHCDELNVSTTLDFQVDRADLLQILVKKLKYDGVIIISGLDMLLLNTTLYSFGISLLDFNALIYEEVDGFRRRFLTTVQNVIDELKYYGLTIIDKHINREAHQFLVKARRNVS